jgi:ubiquinone/menaquinone biosynthesis C-methylase UbiE
MDWLRKIYYRLSPASRMFVRKIIFFPVDSFRILKGANKANEIPLPPKGLIYTGGGNFQKTGQGFINYLTEYSGLKTDHCVLDIGSGIGRMAIPLVHVLQDKGSYYGFDVVKTGVDWCVQHIQKKHPNFHFSHIDLYNDLYRSDGADASKFVFPYKDEQFDQVLATSVFTHLLEQETINYIKESARVLKKGGKMLMTTFLFEEEEIEDIKKQESFSFKYFYSNYALMDKKVKAGNVAYKRSFIMSFLKQNNLVMYKEIKGNWKNQKNDHEGNEFQDVLFLEKITS